LVASLVRLFEKNRVSSYASVFFFFCETCVIPSKKSDELTGSDIILKSDDSM